MPSSLTVDFVRELEACRSFGECLKFHLFRHGTRPSGSPDKNGTIWGVKEFAAAVSKSDKSVQNWLTDRKLPTDLFIIDSVLFGNNPKYTAWKHSLARVHRTAKAESPADSDNDISSRPFRVRFGELVRNIRTRKGFTQSDVARLAFQDEHSISRVSDIERGRAEPRAETINRFCEALDISYEEVEALRIPRPVVATDLSERPLLHLDIRPVPSFTGREDLLEAIETALWQKGSPAAITHAAAVKGLGGVGKSVLAREYAWRNRERYHGIWWVRAETEQTIIEDLIDLGSRLIPNLKEAADQGRALHLALDAIARSATEDKPWLIVYDNLEKPVHGDEKIRAPIVKLTPTTGAHILITSRWPRWHGHAQELPVDVFPEETAANFLIAERPRETREAASRLAAALGCLPLALTQARAYCAETNLSFDDYARRLSELIHEAPEDAEYPVSVFATFSLAIAKAVEACPEAEKLMEIAAFLAPERIPLGIVTDDVMNERQREKAVAALFKVSLITHETTEAGDRAITLHRLVQEVMRGRLGEHLRDAQHTALRLMRSAFGTVDPREHFNWPHLATLLPHAIAVLSLAAALGDEPDAGALCRLLSTYFRARGDFATGMPYAERALAVAEKALGPDHPDTGDNLSELALLYASQGRDREAETLYGRALAIAEKALGPDHPSTANRLNNLAALYRDQGRYDMAKPLLIRALAVAEKALGPDHPDTGDNLNELALLYVNQGRYQKAEALYSRALAIAEKALGPDHPSTANRLNNLAALYRDQGRYDMAKPLLIRALAIAEKALGPDHPDTGDNLNELALLYVNQGRYQEAEQFLKRAIVIFERRLGPDHRRTTGSKAKYDRLRKTMTRDL